MHDRLKETCEREFERYVGVLSSKGERIPAGARDARLLDLASRAIRARAWFARQGPAWCQPLPLAYFDDQERIMCGGDFAHHLVVYYANSLRGVDYDYLEHPLFYDYARGVLAHPVCPEHMAEMPELIAEFPPKPLLGSTSAAGGGRRTTTA